MEIPGYQPTEVEIWARKNLDLIVADLEREREKYFNTLMETGWEDDASKYDASKRCLSEMPLCGVLTGWAPPQEYDLVYGNVVTPDAEPSRPHYFFVRNDKKNIACLLPGQFYQPSNLELSKGERLKALRSSAPKLIFTLSEEITMLSGDREEVKSLLHLDYTETRSW